MKNYLVAFSISLFYILIPDTQLKRVWRLRIYVIFWFSRVNTHLSRKKDLVNAFVMTLYAVVCFHELCFFLFVYYTLILIPGIFVFDVLEQEMHDVLENIFLSKRVKM